MHGGEQVTAVSWGGLCRRGSTVDTRLLFLVLKDAECVQDNRTLHRAFNVLQWSLGALVTGRHPACDELGRPFSEEHYPERARLAGQPLACGPAGGPMCGAWCELRGDWKFLRDALGLVNQWRARSMCHLCGATSHSGPLYYGDHFSGEGVLEETLVGPRHGGVYGWASRDPVSPLTKIPGFSIWWCVFDLTHTLELGLLQRVIPAALQGLLGVPAGTSRVADEASAFAGRSRAARCQAATAAYRDWAAKTKVSTSARVKKITPRWVQGHFPDISQEHAKAAALRAMLPWVVELAQARSGDSRVAFLRAQCLSELARLDKVYAKQPRFLTALQEQQAKAHCSAALGALAELTKLQPSGPWRFIPKAHALVHIAWHSAMGNPRVSHCYQDEDFIGRMKQLYTACHGRTAPLRTLQRYCLGTCIALVAREELLAGKRSLKAKRPGGGPCRGPGAATAPAASTGDGFSLKRGRGRPPKLTAKRSWGRPRKPSGPSCR